MRLSISKLCVGLAFLCMVPVAGFAAEKSYLCAINEVYECVAVSGCSRISVEERQSHRHHADRRRKEAASNSPLR